MLLDAARSRNGAFALRCDLLPAKDGLLFYNGSMLHPLGSPSPESPLPDISGLLGRRESVEALLPKNGFHLFPRDFAFLEREVEDVVLPRDVEMRAADMNDHLEDFHVLTHKFLSEEAGVPFFTCGKTLDRVPPKQPILLLKDGRPIGMVESDFFSESSAMINMLYIEPQYRGKAYGSLLLQWYIRYLQRNSGRICLFYSPENTVARNMYERMGFVKKEEWMLASRVQ